MRNEKLLRTSDSSDRHFRRQRIGDAISLVLLGLMLVVAIWNVVQFIVLRNGPTADLADILNLRETLAGRVMTILSWVTLGIFIFKEWRWGERTLGLILAFLAGWLFLTLVPVMTDEILGPSQDQVMSISVRHCQPGAIAENGDVDRERCEWATLAESDARLALANPVERNTSLIAPSGVKDHQLRWSQTGRWEYMVYFLVRSDSVEQCQQQIASTSFVAVSPTRGVAGAPTCIEQDNSAWIMIPLQATSLTSPIVDIYMVPLDQEP